MVKPRMLIVDDDALVRSALRRSLRDRYEIELAVSGVDALKFLSQGKRYAVIISDLRMPHIDGLTLLAWAAANVPETVRIMLTGHAEESTLEALEAAALFKVVLKPWDPLELIAILDEAVASFAGTA